VKVFAVTMTDIKATDKYEVTVALDGPNVDFPYILTLLQLVIIPEGATNTGIGTGPYKLHSFEPGVRSRTERNRNDWNNNRGFVDSIETLGINDTTARLNALLSGSVHLIERVPATAGATVEQQPELQLFTIPSFGHNAFDMMIDKPPFDSLEFRQALKYAIDREAILKLQRRGYGRLGNDQPIPPLDPYYASDIPQRPYDPDKAKFLAQKSGFSGTVTLSVADAAYVGAPDTAQIFKASAARAGININVNRVPDDGYYQNVWLKQPFVAGYWGGRPTPSLMFSHAYASTSASNVTRWLRPKFDQLLVAARAEFDVAKRKQIYRDMQFMLHEEGGTIIPVFVNYLDAGHKKVKGFVPYPLWEMSGFRAFERVWLES
jgi:peptide/nickel transport system substrate-binding protein